MFFITSTVAYSQSYDVSILDCTIEFNEIVYMDYDINKKNMNINNIVDFGGLLQKIDIKYNSYNSILHLDIWVNNEKTSTDIKNVTIFLTVSDNEYHYTSWITVNGKNLPFETIITNNILKSNTNIKINSLWHYNWTKNGKKYRIK